MSKGRKVVLTALIVAVCASVGWLDLVTGLQLSVSPFYLVPIAIAAWWLGPAPAALAALACVVSAAYAEYKWPHDFPLLVSVWNTFARAFVFGGVAALLLHVKAHQEHLASARDQLEDALALEHAVGRTDGLTGLANRRCFIEALESAVKRRANDLAVAYLDLDNFKTVNDRYGHAAGDALLSTLAIHIGRAVRESDLAARLGGDEFAVIFHRANPAVVRGVLERLLTVVEEATCHLPEVRVGLSIGVVHFRHAPGRIEDLLHQADRAMYRAKRTGKGRVVTEWATDATTEATTVVVLREPVGSR